MKINCDPKSVRITAGQNNRLATASITLDNAFVVRNISVMNGSKGIFVNMPSQKGVDAEGNTKYFDTAFPLSKELRTELSNVVIGAYQQKLAELQNSASQRQRTVRTGRRLHKRNVLTTGGNTMKNIRNKLTFKALTLREAAREKSLALRAKALDTTGEGYVDTAVKIIIAVVIGALLMAGLVALFNNVIMPRVNTEVTELFDAAG